MKHPNEAVEASSRISNSPERFGVDRCKGINAEALRKFPESLGGKVGILPAEPLGTAIDELPEAADEIPGTVGELPEAVGEVPNTVESTGTVRDRLIVRFTAGDEDPVGFVELPVELSSL